MKILIIYLVASIFLLTASPFVMSANAQRDEGQTTTQIKSTKKDKKSKKNTKTKKSKKSTKSKNNKSKTKNSTNNTGEQSTSIE
jgi:Ni/Co efflux regulator RcnB